MKTKRHAARAGLSPVRLAFLMVDGTYQLTPENYASLAAATIDAQTYCKARDLSAELAVFSAVYAGYFPKCAPNVFLILRCFGQPFLRSIARERFRADVE